MGSRESTNLRPIRRATSIGVARRRAGVGLAGARGDLQLDWRKRGKRPSTVRLLDCAPDYLTLLGQLFEDAAELEALAEAHTASRWAVWQKVVALPAVPLHWVKRDLVRVDVIDYSSDLLDDRDVHWDTGEPYPEYLNALVERLKQGHGFPPIIVWGAQVLRGEPQDPFDGRHRMNAALRLNLPVVPAIFLDELYGIGLTLLESTP